MQPKIWCLRNVQIFIETVYELFDNPSYNEYYVKKPPIYSCAKEKLCHGTMKMHSTKLDDIIGQ